MWWNSKCDKTKKLKAWQKSKTQNVTKVENSKYEKIKTLKCEKTEELKMWQHPKTQDVTKLQTQNVTKLQNLKCDKTKNLSMSETKSKIKMWHKLKA